MSGAEREGPGAARAARLDPGSRLQLRIFMLHLGMIGAVNLPLLVLMPWRTDALLTRLALTFSVSGCGLALVALSARQRMLRRSLGLWDEVLAFLALSLGCTILVRLAG